MRTQNFLRNLRDLSVLLALVSLFAVADAAAQAQTPADAPATAAIRPAARNSELYCAGFIEYAPSYGGLEVVGGEQEQEQSIYHDNDFVYISGGSQAGMRVGDEFAVLRPRGNFKSAFSTKKGTLGVFTQEVGRLRVVDVKAQVAVAQVVQSCEMILLGDLLRPAAAKPAPPSPELGQFARFADPNGKPTGRIVLARDGRELLSLDQVVYIDLGAEDNLRAGDRLNIYRPVGKGRIVDFPEEIAITSSGGYESNVFKGGPFSTQAQRTELPEKKRVFGSDARTTPEVKRSRPAMPRKNVGEMLVLSVQQRTAVAVITRVAQEIHTGDHVEVR